ncbi:MAG: hypothetical protein ABMB14_15920, partial [Myxococcota bacterium]
EVAARRGHRAIAGRHAHRALAIAREGSWPDLETDALDLVALVDGDPTALVAAAAIGGAAISVGRRHAIGCVIAARRGALAEAQQSLDRARLGLGSLGLLPDCDALYWLRRAEQALAAALDDHLGDRAGEPIGVRDEP